MINKLKNKKAVVQHCVAHRFRYLSLIFRYRDKANVSSVKQFAMSCLAKIDYDYELKIKRPFFDIPDITPGSFTNHLGTSGRYSSPVGYNQRTYSVPYRRYRYATGTLRVRYRYATPLDYLPSVRPVFCFHPGVIFL